MGTFFGRNKEQMSGQGLPYRLRPNKYVDRELFAEFVSVLVSDASTEKYVYLSMGADHLNDHSSIYRKSGIKNLYSFDREPDVVARQVFNAPIEGVRCESHTSGELPARLDEILASFKAENAIIWLDYTETKRLTQLQEIEAIASKLVPGDVLRVTMNADFSRLTKREASLKKSEKTLPESEKRAACLKLELGSYLPETVTSLDFDDMTQALAKSIDRACRFGAENARTELSTSLVLLTEYQEC